MTAFSFSSDCASSCSSAGSESGASLRITPCTQIALSWTASRVDARPIAFIQMLGPWSGRAYTLLTSIGDWNREFSELVRRGAGEPSDTAPAAGEQAVETDTPVSDADSDQAMAGRRLSIAARLVQLGFIAADRATPENPAVEVLSELLPPDADLGLCLTCHKFSSSTPYPFAETTGIFPNRGSFRMNPALGEVSPHGPPLLTAPRRELVVCTQVALNWTASRLDSHRQDMVTLYSAPFCDIVGATIRHRRKGLVEVWVDDGPTLAFRVAPEAADTLQAHVDQAAQQQ